MFILFLGDSRENSGPTNVNRAVIQFKSKHLLTVNYSNRFGKYLDALCKITISRIVVLSGVSKFNSIFQKIAKLLGKKTVYVMHGCEEYEAIVDGRKVLGKEIHYERSLLQNADLLLPVSEKYSLWVRERYPQYAEKTGYWQIGIPGISVDPSPVERQGNCVSAAGGDWVLKKNNVICKAVEKLKGMARLTVFGKIQNPDSIVQQPYIEWAGNVEHTLFIESLKKQDLFVVNSAIESFCVSVMEALACGCSILVSNNVGASGLMQLEDQDMIFDTNDSDEIAEKIKYLLEHPNNQRIVDSIDWNCLRWSEAVGRLEDVCKALAKK